MHSSIEIGAYPVQKHQGKGNNNSLVRKDYKKAKQDKFCDHCKMKGHTTDQCFKTHGYPDWYKRDKTKSTGPKFTAQVSSEIYILDNSPQS